MNTLKTLLYLLTVFGFSVQDYPFRNVTLSWDDRVDDLVGRLTLDEMTQQMANGGYGGGLNGPAPPIPRLGIGSYTWGSECLHGAVNRNDTSYPQSIGLAATWSTDVVYRMSEATSEVIRALHQATNGGSGLSCFSPVINIMRDPRWGRNQETYGEDPYLSGMLSSAYIQGMHGNHPRYVRTTAGCKHFNVHGGPENIPVSRISFDAKVSIRDWRTTFLPAFRYCVEAGSYSLMCSYNSINGIPACANTFLLTDVLRSEWGFKGYIVSDMAALEHMINYHHYVNNTIDAAAVAVNAGCNLELQSPRYTENVFHSITDAVNKGKVSIDLVRERVKPLFYTRMRHGEFDPPEMNPYTSLNTSVIEDQAHRALAVEAAMKSFVLLKNDGILPLQQQKYDTVAIVGPFANTTALLSGNYEAKPDVRFITTALQGLEFFGTKANYASGCINTTCTSYDSGAIQRAVQGTDVVFVCLGLGTPIEAEENDRASLDYPGHQLQLLQDAVQYSGSAKVILITFNAGPVNIVWAEQSKRVSAILAAFYPGQGTGLALRNVFASWNGSQFGRLPYSWFYSADQVPPITNYTMVNRTYRYIGNDPLYPFGYGLTYTSFNYTNMKFQSTINAGEELPLTITFTNNGSVIGDEIVQVYLSWTRLGQYKSSVPTPKLQLVSFMRIATKPWEEQTYSCKITPENMAVYTEDKGWVVQEGTLYIYGGGTQPNQRKLGYTGYIEGSFKVNGNKVLGFY